MPEFWTSRAWTDSHADYFTRNIWTFNPGASLAEAEAYASWEPNNQRPTWPTLDEVTRWAQSINSYPGTGAGTTVNVENLQLCLDAAIEEIASRTHIQVRPVDTTGAVDEDGTAVEVPARVKLATIMQAVRWGRRPMTPDGIAGASEVTGFIRTSALDPDIEKMLGGLIALGLY